MTDPDTDPSTDGDPTTAEELARYVEEDPDRAVTELSGDVLTVTGEVDTINNVISAVVVRLAGIGEKYNGTHLEVRLQNRDDARALSSEDTVILRGECKGTESRTSPTGAQVDWIVIDAAEVIDS